MNFKKTFFISILLSLFALVNSSSAKSLYLSIGGEYFIPAVNFENYTNNSAGISLELIGRRYCKLWYGVRLDYFKLQKKDNDAGLEFSNNYFISPIVKFAPFTSNCYDNKFTPYLTGMINVGMIEANDGASPFGVGASGGIGLGYNFNWLDRCFMLATECNYSCPNAIYRDKNRNTMQSINVGLNLSVSL